MNTCERITVLDHGQKIAEGTPEEVKSNHSVVEAYLGKEMADDEIRRIFTG
jgi:branched-chain amino acid transport system ATP-binding protein